MNGWILLLMGLIIILGVTVLLMNWQVTILQKRVDNQDVDLAKYRQRLDRIDRSFEYMDREALRKTLVEHKDEILALNDRVKNLDQSALTLSKALNVMIKNNRGDRA